MLHASILKTEFSALPFDPTPEPAGRPGPPGAVVMAGLDSFTGAAWRLERSLAETRASLAAHGAVLDQIGQGAVIVRADGSVLFANGPARRLADTGGFQIATDTFRISADDAEEAARLLHLVAQVVAGGPGGSLRITRRFPRGNIAVNVSALAIASTDLPDVGMALVTLRDLTATIDVAPTQLMALFGLTPAEAAIVPQLVEGETAHVIARTRGVTVATVRSQIARVLTKTGATNLRALASMVAALSG
jgi:DNA-binding CsgD family transcriptional regulator